MKTNRHHPKQPHDHYHHSNDKNAYLLSLNIFPFLSHVIIIMFEVFAHNKNWKKQKKLVTYNDQLATLEFSIIITAVVVTIIKRNDIFASSFVCVWFFCILRILCKYILYVWYCLFCGCFDAAKRGQVIQRQEWITEKEWKTGISWKNYTSRGLYNTIQMYDCFSFKFQHRFLCCLLLRVLFVVFISFCLWLDLKCNQSMCCSLCSLLLYSVCTCWM